MLNSIPLAQMNRVDFCIFEIMKSNGDILYNLCVKI